jgi:methyl-accepting chemotaxis protein
MEGVRASVVDAAALVRAMGERTERIGKIVELISQIAGRTNLLALNAAIEAARAGEHGRGFAVVADEVRKLADGSQKSAAEIADLVQGIEAGTRRAVEAMESGVGQVEREAIVAREAMTALSEILAAVEGTGERVGSISADAAVLADRAGRVTALVQDVASVAQESAASAEEMSAQSLEVAAAMDTIAAASGSQGRDNSETAALRRIAEQLQEATGAFRL